MHINAPVTSSLRLSLAAFLLLAGGVQAGPRKQEPPPPPPSVLASAPEYAGLRAAWEKDQYAFSPAVRSAYLAFAKAQAQRELAAAGKSLPADFLAWIDGDPVVEATVYGARQSSVGILLMLRSLELDLGEAAVRKDYTQLALATAVVHAKLGPQADLKPRPLLKLAIGGDPRQPVDTKDPKRVLDVNDHIINFLNDNTIVEDVVVGQKEELPELKYDAKGVAIPVPKGKVKKVPITEKRTRSLYAADVIASQALQQKFNACMKEKGQAVQIDCGEKIVHWNSHDMVRGPESKKIEEAYRLFKTAYEAKGLLPAARDPLPTPAERCAYLIRNHEYKFPPELQAGRKWPRFPLTAPWPILTILVANDQPLREREERWEAFRDKGEFRTYGEYIGGIAQQFTMQSARRIRPWPFTYGSIQMMLKDGGVCGTMGNISARSHCTLGIPACTAGQPGHCCVILFAYDAKTNTYKCHGGQYATGGDAQTHPHTPWFFGDIDAGRPMIYHQSIAWAVNYGMPAYLDSTIAYAFCRQLPEAERRAHGLQLLESAIVLDPYNFLLVDAAQELAATPSEQIRLWVFLKGKLAAAAKPGCPADGLYNQTIKDRLFANLAKLPVPTDKALAEKVAAFLKEEKCPNAETVAHYQAALNGAPAVMAETVTALQAHLVSVRTDASCSQMAERLTAAANLLPDKKQRREWAQPLFKQAQGHEQYFGRKNKITTDAAVLALAKLSGQKLPADAEMLPGALDGVGLELKASLAGERDIKNCRALAAKIDAGVQALADPAQKRRWLEGLAQTIAGKETLPVKNAKKNAKPVRDPCADAIAKALATLAAKPGVPQP